MKTKLKKILEKFLSKEKIRSISNYRIKKSFLKNKKILNTIEAKENYINKQFFKEFGYKIDFTKAPKTFNEKIQFRKLYSSDEEKKLYAICSDKYKVREYVANKIGEEYLIPLLLTTDKLTLNDWKDLPNECVIKANHNSGPVQIISNKNKVDAKKIINEINFQLEIDYGLISLESYYSLIERKVVVEKLLKNKNGKSLDDYKFYCFNNDKETKILIQVIGNRTEEGYEVNFYDENWEKLDFYFGGILAKDKVKKPENLDKMIEIAKELSKDFDYSRIDLYNLEGKIYFGEITFCPNSGFKKAKPEFWDLKLGEMWK